MPAILTPDGRYIVVRGRLWRAANPALPLGEHGALVQQLMQARRAVKAALASADAQALRQARAADAGRPPGGDVKLGFEEGLVHAHTLKDMGLL